MIACHLRGAFPLALALGLAAILLARPARAADDEGWCRDDDHDRPTHCEVREVAVPGGRDLAVDATPNGGIDVQGWNRDHIRVLAKVTAHGDSEAEARDIASQVRIETAGTIRADGPRTRGRRGWWISYRLSVPSGVRLSLRSLNGGIVLRRP